MITIVMRSFKYLTVMLFCIVFIQSNITSFAQNNNKVIFVKGVFTIDSSVNGITFKCDSTSKILVTGNCIKIENCVFDANGNSVDISLIDCLCKKVFFKNCVIENIRGQEGKGSYGIYIDIEKCSASILSCIFKNISDSREEDAPVGQMKGMCGAIYYSCFKNYLKSKPHRQYVEDIVIENIYTSLPNGEINNKSTDADGIRIFINEKKSPQELLDAQKYDITGVTGRDVQKRLIKISGASNCTLSNVYYKNNRKLSRRYPMHLIAVYDSNNIYITDVDYCSGCNDIAFCGSNSSNITIDKMKVEDNGNWFRKSTSNNLFRIYKCVGFHIKGLKFSGNYCELGQLNNSENIEIELEGKKVSCLSPIEIKDTKNISLSGTLQTVKRRNNSLFKLVNVEDLTVDKELGDVEDDRIFIMKSCSNVYVK